MEINAGLLDKTPQTTLKQSACPEKDSRTGLVWLASGVLALHIYCFNYIHELV